MNLEPRHSVPDLELKFWQQHGIDKVFAIYDRARLEQAESNQQHVYLDLSRTLNDHSCEILDAVRATGAANTVPLAGVVMPALYVWSRTKGIWHFDTDLYRAIKESDLRGKIPVDMLGRLPEWCPYIILENEKMADGRTIDGAFVMITNTHCGPMLVVLANETGATGGDGNWMPMSIPLRETVEESARALRGIWADDPSRQQRIFENYDVRETILKLALYLCSDEPDLTRARPTTKRRRPACSPVRDCTLWPIGIRIGAALRAHASAANSSVTDSGRSIRPHVRRAHWHCYWTGSRTDEEGNHRQGERLALRWIAPILIGGEPHDATVRPVE